MSKVSLNFNLNPDELINIAMKSGVENGFTDGLLDVADELQQQSPIGATKDLKSLWDVNTDRDGVVLTGEITNSSTAAINRIVGRPPGAFPPLAPILDWVRAKIDSDEVRSKRIAYLVGRSIAQRGTKRFRDKNNWAGLNRDGSFIKGGLLDNASSIIIKRIENEIRSKN